jgi:hypothetical protein
MTIQAKKTKGAISRPVKLTTRISFYYEYRAESLLDGSLSGDENRQIMQSLLAKNAPF